MSVLSRMKETVFHVFHATFDLNSHGFCFLVSENACSLDAVSGHFQMILLVLLFWLMANRKVVGDSLHLIR